VTVRLVRPASPEDWRRARALLEEYAASLDVDLCFQDFARELERLPEQYGPPSGAFLLAEEDGALVGCVGLRRFADGVAEMKRLYAVPAVRGRGTGRLLATGIIGAARELGYARLRLDTLPSMTEARRLYASLGFRETAAYRPNPVHGATFFELELG
jgi:GNAT superfamily N-acetyltransferase